MKLRTVFTKYFADDDIGEAEGFYEIVNNDLKLITGWGANDAKYRSEYMNPLLRHLGVEVKLLPKQYEAQAKKLLAEMWGL